MEWGWFLHQGAEPTRLVAEAAAENPVREMPVTATNATHRLTVRLEAPIAPSLRRPST